MDGPLCPVGKLRLQNAAKMMLVRLRDCLLPKGGICGPNGLQDSSGGKFENWTQLSVNG